MPVVSSSYSFDGHVQRDGRRYVTETHVLNVSGPFVTSYLAAAGADYQTIMLARVPSINVALAEDEQRRVIYSDPAAISLVHQTGAEFALAFWRGVQSTHASGERVTYSRLLWWVYEMVLGGWLTSDQVRLSHNTAYNKTLNVAQWNALVSSRILPAHDRYAAILAEDDL